MSLWLVDSIEFSAAGRSTPTVFSSGQPGLGCGFYVRHKRHSVCRMHGAAGGAPKGNRNALKHGSRSAETLAVTREIQAPDGIRSAFCNA